MKQHKIAHLREKFYYSDSRFLFLLFTNKTFRRAFFLCLIILFGTPLSTIKMIRTTPADSLPEIHISLIDWLQAESLGRTARKAAREGKPELAFASWRSAIGNNPGRKGFNRQYLVALEDLDERRELWRDTLQTAQWLIHLSKTNRNDLELACRALELYNFHSQALRFIENYEGPVKIPAQRAGHWFGVYKTPGLSPQRGLSDSVVPTGSVIG